MPKNVEIVIVSTISTLLGNSTTDGLEVVDEYSEQPEAWQTWIYGLSIISVTAFSAPLGIMLTPLMNKSLYDKCMTFLVALGIGAMSGSCLFILLPHAFNITQDSEMQYLHKCLLIAGAIYTFFGVDRLLQCILEVKRRRQRHTSKIHSSTLDSMANEYKNVKNSSIIARRTRTQIVDQTTLLKVQSNHEGNANEDKEEEEREKERLRDEIDISSYNSTLARTLSTRRRIAIIKPEPVDQIQYQKTNGKMLEIDVKSLNSPTSSRNVSPLSSPQLNSSRNSHAKFSTTNPTAQTAVQNQLKSSAESDLTPTAKQDKVAVSVEIHEKNVIERVEIASVAYMIIFGSSMNNFVDGMSIGAAFSDSVVRGVGIGIAVMSEQLPQELGTLAILINSGLGLRRTLIFSIVPMVLSFLGFTLGVFLDNMDDSYDGLIFAVSAGMYLYIVLGTLLPEIREQFNEQLRTDMVKAIVTTLLQVVGIFVGLLLMFIMNVHNDEI